MKKGAIITAIALIAAGALLFIGVLLIFGLPKPAALETKTYPVESTFTDISIRSDEAEIRLLPSPDGTASVVCAEAKGVTHTVTVQDGTLRIDTVDNRPWYRNLFTFLKIGKQSVIVYLPEKEYRDLTIENHTGDVDLPDGFAFRSIGVTCSTGHVNCGASASESVTIGTSTGHIELDGVRTKSLALSVTTGNILARNVSVEGAVSMRVSTGKANLNGLTCRTLATDGSTGRLTLTDAVIEGLLSVKRSTGDVSLENCAAGSAEIETSTGDVRFENSDAETITVRTTTGDVKGTLRSDKIFEVRSDTGKIDVPQSAGSGRCGITTDTGNIRIEVTGAKNP